jgi:hypothetical protein
MPLRCGMTITIARDLRYINILQDIGDHISRRNASGPKRDRVTVQHRNGGVFHWLIVFQVQFLE